MLLVPDGANTFGLIQDNHNARVAASQGTSVTPAVGSKGSWAQAISSLTSDVYGLMIVIHSNNTSGASRNSAVDIGIGGAGSETVLIPNLLGGNATGYTSTGGGLWYYFPVFIAAGTRVAVRAQSTVTTAFNVFIQTVQRPLNPAMVKSATYAEALGISLPTGTALTSGTSAEGSWTLMGTTSKPCWHWQLGAEIPSSNITHSSVTYTFDLAVGNGTSFNVILQNQLFVTTSAEVAFMPPYTIGAEFPVDAGASIYIRGQCSGTPQTVNVAAYGAGG
jgi:hypothetical protein